LVEVTDTLQLRPSAGAAIGGEKETFERLFFGAAAIRRTGQPERRVCPPDRLAEAAIGAALRGFAQLGAEVGCLITGRSGGGVDAPADGGGAESALETSSVEAAART
jgi:hypothetical protein